MSLTEWQDSYAHRESTESPNNVFPLNQKRHRESIELPRVGWWSKIINRLEYLVTLPKGWDGYAAPPVRFQNAYFAATILSRICADDSLEPHIVPGHDGDLQIEWHLESAIFELHIIAPNNVIAWYGDDSTGEDGIERRITNNFIWAIEILDAMKDRNLGCATAEG